MSAAPDASALYAGIVVHRRFAPRRHVLRYRMFMALLDLDELDRLDARLRLFSRNRWNLFSFHDRDHLEGAGAADLRGQIESRLAAAGTPIDGGAIRLLSLPRILGWAFNPLSVYFCHRADGALAAILYEVNNTFRQRHTYVIPVDGVGTGPVAQRADKVFYVSPFLEMDLVYDFRIVPPGESVSVAVAASRGATRMLGASFAGARRPLSDAALLRAFLAYPLLNVAVVAGIHWEALKLWLKGVGLHTRPPPPAQPATIVSRHEV